MNANLLKWAGAFVLFASWVALVILHMTPVEPLVGFISLTLAGLGAHGLTVSGKTPTQHAAPPAPAGAPTLPNGEPRPHLYVPGQKQAGSFTFLFGLLLALIVCLVAVCLSGCSTVQTQVNAVGDQELTVGKGLICNLRLTTIMANPDVIPGLKALCLPPASAPTADTLLTPEKK